MAERVMNSVANHVSDRYGSWQDARVGLETKWEYWRRQYRLVNTEADSEHKTEQSRIKIPATKNAVSGAVRNLMEILFSRDPFFDIDGRQVEDDIVAAGVKAYMSALFEREGFHGKMRNFTLEQCLYGTAIGFINISTEIEKKGVYEDKSVLGHVVGKQFVAVSKQVNRPTFEPISLFDFYIHPNARTVNDAEGVIVRTMKKRHELYELERQGIITGVDEILTKSEISSSSFSDDTAGRTRRLADLGLTVLSDDEDVEVLTYWGWIGETTLKEAGYEGEIIHGGAEVVAMVANQTTALKLTPNPHYSGKRPFVVGYFEPMPNEFYGVGIAEATEGPQRALDASVRQRIDNKTSSMNQMHVVDITKLAPGYSLTSYPGKVWAARGDVNNVLKPIPVPDVSHESYIFTQDLERYINLASGWNPMLSGQASKKGEQSATESSILERGASLTMRDVAASMESMVLKPLLRWYYDVIIQYLDVPEIVRVVPANSVKPLVMTLESSQMVGDFDFVPRGVTTMNRQNEAAQLMEFIARTANPIMAPYVNFPYLLKKIYESKLGDKDADMAVRAIPPQQAMAMAQNMPNQGSQPKTGGAKKPGMGSPTMGEGTPPKPRGGTGGKMSGGMMPGGMMGGQRGQA